jgi:asparagine synthase (glutamine-hydrolysing)
MCGLSALLDPNGADLARAIRAMNAAVRHRGPDDEGFAFFADGPWRLALGHRRLSIVDLSAAGHQPMTSADGNLCIIYNGEVYNHIELRAELEKEGVRFATRSDTEVMLAAYRRWGEKCLERFNGMFAFILVDWARKRVFAARDRFGVKPLYYWTSPSGQLAFASEIKQFTVLEGWRAVMNGQRVYDFINWGLSDHAGETLFQGVRQLRGGEYVSASLEELGRGIRPRQWYRLAPRPTQDEPVRAWRELLEDSVRLRLRADVPVGSCLSGGLDSSAIVCVANRALRAAGAQQMQRTFSARSTDPRLDEGRFIDAVVRHTGVANAQVEPPAARLFDELSELTWHQDEPFGSTSIYAQSHVFALAARNGVKVMLDGQGADEQLAGYASFHAARFGHLARGLRLATLLSEIRAVSRRLPRGQVAAYAVSSLVPDPLRQLLRRLGNRASTHNPCLDMARLGARHADPFLAQGANAPNVEALSVSQLLHTSLPMLLHWEDRDSMQHSIEARVPFLDYRLVELTLGLPEEEKLSQGITKRVLREAMRGVLPEEVRARTDKIGFATAEEQWLRRENPEGFRAAMRQAVEASQGILRPAALELLDGIIGGARPFSYLPWRMISFGAWVRRFDVKLA